MRDREVGRRSTVREERRDWGGGAWTRRTGLLGTVMGSGSG